MILFFGVIVLSVLAGYLLGGRLRAFERLRLRMWALAPIGLALQALPLPNGRHGTDLLVRVAVFSASFVLLLLFAAMNFRVAGMPLLFFGLTLNFVVIAGNGGMPVSRHALEASGQGDVLEELLKDEGAKHHLLTADDHLTFLADVIPVGPPIKQVMSVGDVFVYAGLAWLIVAVMRGRTGGLAPAEEQGRYRGRHRLGMERSTPSPSAPPSAPPEATMWGT
jgi:hypothetical protein